MCTDYALNRAIVGYILSGLPIFFCGSLRHWYIPSNRVIDFIGGFIWGPIYLLRALGLMATGQTGALFVNILTNWRVTYREFEEGKVNWSNESAWIISRQISRQISRHRSLRFCNVGATLLAYWFLIMVPMPQLFIIYFWRLKLPPRRPPLLLEFIRFCIPVCINFHISLFRRYSCARKCGFYAALCAFNPEFTPQ